MLFNSLSFAIFFPVVFFLYWFVAKKNLRHQNILLSVASYYFYACWDWRFMFLLLFSTILDYYTGLQIEKAPNQKMRKFWLWLSIGVNLGFLGLFKYYNFFVQSFSESVSYLGLTINPWTLEVILPVGISFYTFHGLSYVIDIYNKRIHAERNYIDYSLFVAFFPLLVAGPIERATHLLPQVKKERVFEYSRAVDGMRQILWGLFKKVVIADNCAVYANMIFENPGDHSGSTLVLGALFFTFQIYGDFSGYSDIALGTARLLGFDLLRNFAYPYFSRDIAEFWRRWHISLSSWFRDYVYIPLGGSKGGMWMKVRNTFIIFLLSGFWHGANWTFIIWGLLNAIYFLPLLLTNKNRTHLGVVAEGRSLPTLKELGAMLLTFSLTVFAWIFFRAESVGQAFVFIKGIFSPSIFSIPDIVSRSDFKQLFLLLAFFIGIEWWGRSHNYGLAKIQFFSRSIYRTTIYVVLLTLILFFGNFDENEFIYFQF